MPFATINSTRLYYRLEGSRGQPVLVLSHALGTDHSLWDLQVRELLPHFQIVRYDGRGHGASESPAGEYTMEQLGRDVLGLVDALSISRFAFCGLSMGGAVGQWLAAHAADRLTALVLANTSPRFDASTLEARRQAVLKDGMPAVVDTVMQRFFVPETLAREDPYASSTRSVLLGTERIGYAGCCAAIRDVNYTARLRNIRVPTLVIVGERDVSTPWSGHGEMLAKQIDKARVVHLPTAHLSNIERPRSFTTALMDFLLPAAGPSHDPLPLGEKVRRAVLGDEYVDRSSAARNDFNRDFQLLLTRYAWGSVWARPGLDHRTRRLLVLAMMPALGRWEEFRLHLRAGLKHELEACDIKEVLLLVAVYAGVPAANTAFHIVDEEMKEAGDPA